MALKHADIIAQMTLEEKASLLSGHKSWFTNQISRLNIPKIMMTDGPHGLRKKREREIERLKKEAGEA